MRLKKDKPAGATKKLKSRERLLLVRALFEEAFKQMRPLLRNGDRQMDLHDNVYGSEDPDLEKDLMRTVEGWLRDLDE